MTARTQIVSRRTRTLLRIWAVLVVMSLSVAVVAYRLESPFWYGIGALAGIALAGVLAIVLLMVAIVSCAMDIARRGSAGAVEDSLCVCGAVLEPVDTSCAACGFDWNDAKPESPGPIRSRFGPGRCHRCGYDTASLAGPRCPECGSIVVEIRDTSDERREDWVVLRKGAIYLAAGSTLTAAVGALLIWVMAFDVAPVLAVVHGAVVWGACGTLFWTKAGREVGQGEDVPPTGMAYFGLVAAWSVWLYLVIAIYGIFLDT